jgi:glycine hydroxymethyltransferase
MPTRGMKENDMDILADFMLKAIEKRADDTAIAKLHDEVIVFCRKFPVPGIKA